MSDTKHRDNPFKLYLQMRFYSQYLDGLKKLGHISSKNMNRTKFVVFW